MMMNQGLVSVVLPIYNVEKYLDRCMESVVNQTYRNIEILMVDDGATDSCPDICEKWAKKDERVKVIHKKNAGLGMARNTGIENASGEYIVFFDSDDYIELDTIEKCYKKAVEDNAELVLFGHSLISPQGKVKARIVPYGKKSHYSGLEVQKVVLPNLLMQSSNAPEIKNLWMSAWSCFYSCELIKKVNWKFVSEREIISEDVYSLLQLMTYLDSVSIIEESLYNYCENAASLTHVFRDDRFEKINTFYNKTVLAAKQMNYDEEIVSKIAYPYIA
ncbi:glycosyltransferase family 2 protein, partial [Pseudobutyrivibrio sp.]